MSTDPQLLWTAKPPPPRKPRPSELLFEFIKASNGAPMRCELRFNGESYGWEVLFYERGDLFMSHGAWVTRAVAVAWAEGERDRLKK